MTVVPTASGETNLSPATVTNVSGDGNTTSQGTPGTTAPVSGGPVTGTGTTSDGGQGLPVLRRNRPGTKTAAFCAWPEEDWTEMDSTLAVQQVR